jgi:hypothetical protein
VEALDPAFTAASISGEMVRDLMIACVQRRFGAAGRRKPSSGCPTAALTLPRRRSISQPPWGCACASPGPITGFEWHLRASAHSAATLHRRFASASSRAFNVSSTLPRTARSRWLLIRSSSIVMALLSGLGGSAEMAAPFCCPGCV